MFIMFLLVFAIAASGYVWIKGLNEMNSIKVQYFFCGMTLLIISLLVCNYVEVLKRVGICHSSLYSMTKELLTRT